MASTSPSFPEAFSQFDWRAGFVVPSRGSSTRVPVPPPCPHKLNGCDHFSNVADCDWEDEDGKLVQRTVCPVCCYWTCPRPFESTDDELRHEVYWRDEMERPASALGWGELPWQQEEARDRKRKRKRSRSAPPVLPSAAPLKDETETDEEFYYYKKVRIAQE